MDAILAVDPGSHKCGLAVVDCDETVLERQLVSTAAMRQAVQKALSDHPVVEIIVGNSTTSRAMLGRLRQWFPEHTVLTVEERGSTLEARHLYWQVHPPRGWRRLLPLPMQVPPEPVDDFAAVVLALRFLAGRRLTA